MLKQALIPFSVICENDSRQLDSPANFVRSAASTRFVKIVIAAVQKAFGMILDHLDQSETWSKVHPRFPQAFDFLRNVNWSLIEDGRHLIDGENLFVIVATDQGRGREESPLEIHRRYIDIQYVIKGHETIGWRHLASCSELIAPFDESRDIGFFREIPESWFDISPGSFALFFPSDAHAPLAGQSRVRKAVVKVAV
jgi:biofilm protein TabA